MDERGAVVAAEVWTGRHGQVQSIDDAWARRHTCAHAEVGATSVRCAESGPRTHTDCARGPRTETARTRADGLGVPDRLPTCPTPSRPPPRNQTASSRPRRSPSAAFRTRERAEDREKAGTASHAEEAGGSGWQGGGAFAEVPGRRSIRRSSNAGSEPRAVDEAGTSCRHTSRPRLPTERTPSRSSLARQQTGGEALAGGAHCRRQVVSS